MNKKRVIILLSLVALIFGTVLLAFGNDIKQTPSCKYCGMNREMFAHSRMVIEYEDGTAMGTCSLHCAIVDLALNLDKNPKAILVGDYGTKALIDAEKAIWIIGGNKPGVMTKNAKWAFAKKEDAEKFKQEQGGRLASFDEAVEAAHQDLYNDTKMIRERRKMRRMQMEKK
jgi:copper chaperone NosL